MQIQLIEKLNQLILVLEKNQAVSQTSPATQIILSVVPVLAIIFGAALLFFFFLWSYKLKRELIKTGQYTHTTIQNLRMLTLLVGILSSAVGIPMTILFYAMEAVSYILLGGLIPMFAGIGLLLFYIFSRKHEIVIINKKKR